MKTKKEVNLITIYLPIVTMQHLRDSLSASQNMGISAWNVHLWTTLATQLTSHPV